MKKNFFFNFSLNFINILFPLITLPYVSAVLGADNLGKCNFALSLSSWFLIFATFGTTTYGIREIARVRDNQQRLNTTFSEIFIIKLIATIISIIIFVGVIFVSPKTNNEITLFLITALSILMNLFCIDWLYMGLEKYGLITLRNLIIKVTCIIGIFIFIQKKDDYIIYTLISVLAFGLANIYNFSKKNIKFTINVNIMKHLKKLKMFFLSSLIVSLYTLFDQVFLGFYSTNIDVAFYSRSKQIYLIALSITLSISTVLLPRFIYLFENDFESYKKLLKKSINYIYIFSVPSVVGLIILSKDIMWLLGGKEFVDAYSSLIIISILVFTVSLGTWQYEQLFLPLGREKIGINGQFIMAVISIIFNIILVPNYGYIGASISLVLAEISGTIFGVYYAKYKITEVKVDYITKSLIKYILSSGCMMLVIVLFKLLGFGYIINILFSIIIGSLIYFTVLYIIGDNICREVINYLIDKMKKRWSV